MQYFYSLIIVLMMSNIGYCANDWIPYQAQPSPPQVYVPQIPSVTYSTQETWVARPLILTYDWVPYYTTKTTVMERQGLLCKYRTVISQPSIEWIYQPVWK